MREHKMTNIDKIVTLIYGLGFQSTRLHNHYKYECFSNSNFITIEIHINMNLVIPVIEIYYNKTSNDNHQISEHTYTMSLNFNSFASIITEIFYDINPVKVLQDSKALNTRKTFRRNREGVE